MESCKKKVTRLEYMLQNLDGFETPNIALEQYPTPPKIAALLLNTYSLNTGEIEGKIVGDLGCGCGTLTLGAALCGAAFTIGFDIDDNALEIARINKEDTEMENVDFIQCDVKSLLNDTRWHKQFDTVILNPPFGTKDTKGTDMIFLKTACALAREAVYSLHKTATIEHIQRVALSWNVQMKPMYNLKFNIDKAYNRHKIKSKDIEVTVIQITFPKPPKYVRKKK